MKKKIGIISILLIVVIVIISTILLTNKEDNKSINLDNGIAYMYEDDNGEYEPGNIDKWDEGYALNIEESSCEEEILSWDNNTNEVLLTTDKPTKCTLYFDQKEYVLLSGYPMNDKDVQLTNILGYDGDFENAEAWQGYVIGAQGDSNYIACQLETAVKQHGTYSCKISGDDKYLENIVISTTSYPIIVNHKYYLQISGYKNNNSGGGIQIYWPVTTGGNITISKGDFANRSNVWETFSTIFYPPEVVKNDGNHTLRLDNNNNNQNTDIYFDEFMIIDLTASYNSNIPSQDELDKELIYFDGTVDMKKVKGKEGVFQVSDVPNNAPIECNNGGKATVTDGQVTITGGAPITTCYLKKEQS